MSRAVRLIAFFAAALVCLPLILAGLRGLPAFGQHTNPYGDAVNAQGEALRHVTNMVAAVNFDIRGIDTLGEEFILFTAVTGVVMLLRGARGEARSADPSEILHRRREGRSEAVTGLGRWVAPTTLVFGLYVILHGQLTPGGGFQGGVIVAASALLVYFGEGYAAWRLIVHSTALDVLEACGVAIYLVVGLVPLFTGGSYLENVLPLGEVGSMLSGGIIPILNVAVGMAVIGGFCTIALEFLEETRQPKEDDE
ncbi:multisubunit sodium/proton antiporter, MrpB subunit [Faunimonas pinastri]|uniref:Multisubunit sodium/proton antiporter, MrpB subunit n=1 Tax=Faunimonas pinastri TaxID=1855383 RepID=A0A1H9LGP0_9HYPH|nr:MnhB domain-containing protein [Faunimonas pinastri]SER10285.1 multisubunit sodium/proton antiporter, MrpB subunit [Faunimonas pinastri]